MRTKMKAHKRWLAWLPALIVIGASMVTAAGISLIPSAGAANPAQVVVNGTVAAVADISLTNCPAGSASTDFPSLSSAGNFVKTANDCTIDVTTNDVLGVTLSQQDDRVPNTNPAFCKPAACATASSQLNDATANSALGDGQFGLALTGVSGTGATALATLNAGSTAAGAWYPVANTATNLCDNTSTAALSCTFRFGVDTKNPQDSGAYNALVRFTATPK